MTTSIVALLLGAVIGVGINPNGLGGRRLMKIRHTIWGTKKRRVATTVATLVLVPAVALAAWLLVNQGDGAVKVGSLQNVTVSPNPAAQEACYPGNLCAGAFTLTNPNGALEITRIVGGDVDGSGPAICLPHLNANTGPEFADGPIPVPAGVSDVVIPDAYVMDNAMPSSCQGESLTKRIRLEFATP